MDELISRLVPLNQQRAAKTLLQDHSTKQLILKQLSELAMDSTQILLQSNPDLLLCKLATFGADEDDTMRIYHACALFLKQPNCSCSMLAQSGHQFKLQPPSLMASQITVCLGFFREHAERKHKYHAAPSPEYYQRMAVGCYAQTGYFTIAEDLDKWLTFLHESFQIKQPI
jgi:hypothetical protein